MVKTRALMIRYTSQNQLTFDGFKTPFDASLFVELRKRIGHDAYKKLNSHVINTYEELTGKKKAKKTNHAKTDPPVGESKMKNKNEHENQVEQSGRPITSEEQTPKKRKTEIGYNTGRPVH